MKLTGPEQIARGAMWVCLAAVGGGGAILSFHALRDLGTMSKFNEWAWLLPIVIDAGALAGTLVWLGRWAPARARDFGQWLSLVLLGLSVGGNALSHGLFAANPGKVVEHIAADWTIVVGVSAIPPAVLGAVVHLAVLTTEQRGQRTAGQSSRRNSVQASAPGPGQVVQTAALDAVQEPRPAQTDRKPARALSMSDPDTTEDFLKWAAELDHTPSTYEVRQRMGCGHNRAKKLLDELDRAVA